MTPFGPLLLALLPGIIRNFPPLFLLHSQTPLNLFMFIDQTDAHGQIPKCSIFISDYYKIMI